MTDMGKFAISLVVGDQAFSRASNDNTGRSNLLLLRFDTSPGKGTCETDYHSLVRLNDESTFEMNLHL
jgi:hypothetical protein